MMEKNSLIKNGFWITYGAFTTRILALVSNLLLARLLLPSEFGVISIAYIFGLLVIFLIKVLLETSLSIKVLKMSDI